MKEKPWKKERRKIIIGMKGDTPCLYKLYVCVIERGGWVPSLSMF
jgi:hypothetical protein